MESESYTHEADHDPLSSSEARLTLPDTSTQIAFALALAYAVGLLTTNAFLRGHGLSDFSLLRPKAIITGAIVILTLSLIAIYPARMLGRVIQYRRLEPGWRVDLILKCILPWITVVALCFLAERFGKGPQISNQSRLNLRVSAIVATELFFSALAVKMFGVQMLKARASTVRNDFVDIAFAWTTLAIWTTALFFAFACYIAVFAKNFYVEIPQQFGGGMPECLQFALKTDKDSTKALENLGIGTESGNPTLTKAHPVIYESDKAYTLIAESTVVNPYAFSTVSLSKDLINASIWHESKSPCEIYIWPVQPEMVAAPQTSK